MDRDFQRRARLNQADLEKEVSGGEELANESPYRTPMGEGAENVMDREARDEPPVQDRGYRRLDEPNR